jgi:hypothetical protein
MIDEVSDVLGWDRKHAIKALNGKVSLGKKAGRRGSKATYSEAETAVIVGIWKHSEQPCGTRLKQTLPLWLNSYQARHGSLEASIYQKILTCSPRTLDRITAPIALRVAAASDAKPVEPATGSKNLCRSAAARKPSTSRVGSKPTPSHMEAEAAAERSSGA